MGSSPDHSNRFGLAERLKQRRIELRYSRDELIDIIRTRGVSRKGLAVSSSTLKNMENSTNRYRLPKKKSSKNKPMPLDLIADALSVPLGYLLAGFSPEELQESFYGQALRAGHISLISELRPKANREKTLAEFVVGLPSTEEELFELPLYSFRNQYALSVIFRIERVFSGHEMLLVNEPPFILWDDDDVDSWITSMDMSSADAKIFHAEFADYRKYFLHLVESNKKTYKVVVNIPTLRKFLKRKKPKGKIAFLQAALKVLKYENFNMILFESIGRYEGYEGDGTLHEYEVLCKHQVIPMSLEDTVACQILQTPPHQSPTSYFISPTPKQTVMIQRQIARIDSAWAEAITQYVIGMNFRPSDSLSDSQIRTFTEKLLKQICEE